MHEEGDHATKNQLSGLLLQGDGLEERLEQWECILHDQHGRLLPQRLANGPLRHHHFAQIRRKEEAPPCEPTHVEKSATSKDNFKASQAADVREGDWVLGRVDESSVPSPHRARAEYTQAMEAWDADAADAAVAGLRRGSGAAETMEPIWRMAVRDQRN